MSEREPLSLAQRQRALARAVELQSEADAKKHALNEEEAMRRALREVGVDDAWLDQAAVEVVEAERREAAARAEAAAARAKVARRGLTIGALTAVGVGLATALWPAPLEPFLDPLDGPAGWSVEVNPGSKARLSWPAEAGRGAVATIDVERWNVDAEGLYFANFDGTKLPPDPGAYSSLSFDVRGTLPQVRVYLEAGAERWRSPPVSVSADWTTVQLDLRSFERQRRGETGVWRVIDWTAPAGIQDLSFKLGWYVNPSDALGQVQLDAVRWE